MAVVINDFEVVPAPPPPQSQAAPPPGQAKPAPARQAAELERQLRRRHERAARIRAH